MFFSLLFSLSASKLPIGFEPLPVNDSHVTKFALPFLNQYLESLFPEINLKKDFINITEAGLQKTLGFNLYLEINVSQTLSISVTLWVSVRNKVQLKEVNSLILNENNLNAFNWLDPAHFTLEKQNQVINLIKKYRNINLKVHSVLAYRVKEYAGTRQHVIFADTNGIIHSIMTHYCHSTNSFIIEFYESINYLSLGDDL